MPFTLGFHVMAITEEHLREKIQQIQLAGLSDEEIAHIVSPMVEALRLGIKPNEISQKKEKK